MDKLITSVVFAYNVTTTNEVVYGNENHYYGCKCVLRLIFIYDCPKVVQYMHK